MLGTAPPLVRANYGEECHMHLRVDAFCFGLGDLPNPFNSVCVNELAGLTCVDVAHVDKRIIGGTNVVQGTYKWAVKLTALWSDRKASTCSGNILSNKWILTAAHCCVDAQLKIVRSVVEAGNPNVAVTTFDIALLKLSTPFDLTRPNVSTVKLPTTKNATLPQANEAGVIVGFGYFLHPDIYPTTAQVATFKVMTQQKCAQSYGVYNVFNSTYNFCVDDDVTRRAVKMEQNFTPSELTEHTITVSELSKGSCFIYVLFNKPDQHLFGP
ncbi:hypothetical protein T265_15762, partial [Opisthorchis viverrini]